MAQPALTHWCRVGLLFSKVRLPTPNVIAPGKVDSFSTICIIHSQLCIMTFRCSTKKAFIDIRLWPRYCNASPYGPLWPNAASSIKPKVHNVSQCRQRRTEPWPQGSCKKFREDRSSGSRDMLTDRNTHRQTDKLIVILHSPTRNTQLSGHIPVEVSPQSFKYFLTK